MTKQKTNKTILCLFPNTFGVCYAVLDTPNDLIDYGIGYVRPVNNKKSILKVKKYLDFFKPEIVLLRELTNPNSKINKRNKKLINLICDEAHLQRLKIHQFNRTQIKDALSNFKVSTKHQISKKIIEWFPVLEELEYPYRKEWMAENHNVGVFDAISLAAVYYYLNGIEYGYSS